ncbi:MAG: SEC-C metal-binding domain-containing protein, partial [Gemmatimonadota bacterium]
LPEGTRAELAAFLRVVGRSVALSSRAGEADVPRALARALEAEFEAAAEEASDGEEPDEETVRAGERLDAARRNDPCPCGSGRKYKDCHWLEDRRRVRG